MNYMDSPRNISVKEGRKSFIFVYKNGGIIINGYKLPKVKPDMEIPEQIGNKKVIGIAKYAFEYCSSLRSVYMSGGIDKIGFRAFFGCVNLEEVVFPETLKVIGCQAFFNCKKLKEVNLPKQLRVIDGAAFHGCKSLKKVAFPDNIEIIRSSFVSCSSLESVTLPANLKELGGGAFSNCDRLQEVTFSDKMTPKNLMDMKIGHGVFQYDPLLENSDGNVIVGKKYTGKSVRCANG